MRKIKFRGKLSHSKEWIDGNLIIANNGHPYIIPPSIFEPDGHHLRIDSDNPFWIDPETVGQFTGLKDKNGKEIYEGDVCNCSYGYTNDKIGIVYYEDGCFYVDDKHPSGNMPLKSLVNNYANRIEIIDNIHNNPELLQN